MMGINAEMTHCEIILLALLMGHHKFTFADISSFPLPIFLELSLARSIY